MKWQKKGRVYVPDGRTAWAKKYAFPPTPVPVRGDRLRLYMAFCDDTMVGRIGYVEVAADDPSRVLGVSHEPVLDVGRPGDFDENGLLPTCVVPVGDQLFMYYVGYQLGHKVRYYQFEGLAISDDGGRSFRRHSRVPVIDRSDTEPHHRTSAFVMRDGGRFKMWYVAGGDWTPVGGKSLPVYNLRYVESPDGTTWPREGKVCLDFAGGDEHAFGRPWVLKSATGYRMFYSIRTRSKGYRLGYAESADGISWRRKDDEVGIDVSPEGWDSQMIAYG
ncbi:MAG TPA: hypothetical protein VH120_07740, partial [Gemmataceae bacterium]|nr:hypothetical protein [Gemmataceae bacterium]